VCSIYIQAGGHEHTDYIPGSSSSSSGRHISIFIPALSGCCCFSLDAPLLYVAQPAVFYPPMPISSSCAFDVHHDDASRANVSSSPFFFHVQPPKTRKNVPRLQNKKIHINIKQSRFKKEIKVDVSEFSFQHC
jgi:hypothetical protein